MRSHIAQTGHLTNRNLRRKCQENPRISTNRFDSPRGAYSKLERRLAQIWESNSMIITLNSKLAVKDKTYLTASTFA